VTEGMPNRDPALGDGSSMIPYEVLRALPAHMSVTLLTFASELPAPDEVAERCERVVVIPKRGHQTAVARSLLSRSQVGTQERATRAARVAVKRLSAQHDVTLIHGPHAAFLAHDVVGPVVIQVVDPWSLRVSMEVGLATGWRAWYRQHKAGHLLEVERRLPERTRLLTVGRGDAEAWSSLLERPVRSIDNGCEEVFGGRQHSGTPTVCFAGSLNYAPNIESAQLLVQEIAPLLWKVAPDLRIVLAGRQPDPAVLLLASERVTVLANVPSLSDVFLRSDVGVFPDRRGLGVRNCVREALATGLPVVATPAAARGQPCHALLTIADDTPDLVDHVLSVLAREREAAALAVTPSAIGTARMAAPQEANVSRTWRVAAQEYYEECVSAQHMQG